MSFESTLTKDELARYNKQIRLSEIGKEGQIKLKTSSNIVIGVSVLDCHVLQYLSVAGKETLGIVVNVKHYS